MTQVCAHGSLNGFHMSSYLMGIPLLQYADDTPFFIEGSVEEARNISSLLDLFADCLGLPINRAKSAFVGFGLSQEEDH